MSEISFVWPPDIHPFVAGGGGTENYTVGHIRELRSRGIDAELVTVGYGTNDGREHFPDIPFRALTPEEVTKLELPVFVMLPMQIKTEHQAYVILHCAPPPDERGERDFYLDGTRDKRVIATSNYAAQLWADYLGRPLADIGVAHPFADAAFGEQTRPAYDGQKTRVLVPNRLTPEKGIYTFMAALHFDYILPSDKYEFTVIAVGADSHFGKLILPVIEAHPLLRVVPQLVGAAALAELFVKNDIVLVPSNAQFWHETFGMVSVEAQQAGCRVVASKDGGLLETDCGGVIFVEPDNPIELAKGIAQAASQGALTASERSRAMGRFGVKESVDALLNAISYSRE